MKPDTHGDVVVSADPARGDCQQIVLRLQRFRPGTQPPQWRTRFGLATSRQAKAACHELAKGLDYQQNCIAFEPYFPDEPAFPFDYEY